MRSSLISYAKSILDLVYPPRCPACMVTLAPEREPGDFCPACEEELHPIEPPFCAICAEPFPGEIPGEFVCPNCSGRKVAFEFTVCRWLSRGPVREVIHRL